MFALLYIPKKKKKSLYFKNIHIYHIMTHDEYEKSIKKRMRQVFQECGRIIFKNYKLTKLTIKVGPAS